MNAGKKLRTLLENNDIIVSPGAFDAFSARIIAEAGFPSVYLSGACVTHSLLGKPDIGLTGLTEMATAARNIVEAAGNTPVIADADTGYGGILNVMRTVCEYEHAGVACIQLEDQVFPKRCGHMEGKKVISKEDMVSKVKAAVSAKSNPDTLIMARTDARAVNGFDDALDRAKAYVDAGADIIFFEAPRSIEEMKAINDSLDVPLLANMVEKGKTPLLSVDELAKIGYRIVIYPATVMMAAAKAMSEVCNRLKAERTSAGFLDRLTTFNDLNQMLHLQELRELEESFT